MIIPIYNAERYLKQCLDSIINQTLIDIDIICVNDGSTDSSLKILQQYARKDKRIQIINKQYNEGTHLARKNAVLAARGKYTVFIDPDDLFTSSKSLEIVYQKIEQEQVDILMFSCKIFGDTDYEDKRIVEDFVKVYEKEIFGAKNIIQDCIDMKYGWTLWNKIYITDNVVKAYRSTKDVYLITAEDCYVYILISYYSKSFKGILTNPIYSYRRDNGITVGHRISLDKFKIFLKEIEISKLLNNFFKINTDFCFYKEIIDNLKLRFLRHCIWRLVQLKSEDISTGYQFLIESFGYSNIYKVISCIYEQLRYNNRIYFLNGSLALKSNRKYIKTIGIFYHRYYQGGVERVISLQIPILLRLGYKVVLITEEGKNEDDYYLSSEVKRYFISKTYENGRANDLSNILLKNNIDVILYHAASYYLLLFDILLIKSYGIRFILERHEVTTVGMAYSDTFLINYHKIYQFVDKLLVLSNIEKQYYRNLGINAEYIPNPIPYKLGTKKELKNKIILWVGRLDNLKNYMDPLRIFNLVRLKHPDSKLIMLGAEYSEGASNNVKEYIFDHNLQQSAHWLGNVHDMERYYKISDVFLMTSASESFSMAIAESKSFGLPMVSYDLKNLELLSDGKGFISVNQDDLESAASKICLLFENKNIYQKLSAGAIESIRKFKNFDQNKAWENLFKSFQDIDKSKVLVDKNFSVFINDLYFYYSKGVYARNNEISKLRDKFESHKKFRIWKYLKYKILSKILFGKRRLLYRKKYKFQKILYRDIKNGHF